jgi:hypothetical protein
MERGGGQNDRTNGGGRAKYTLGVSWSNAVLVTAALVAACVVLLLQLDARQFNAQEWPRIREGISIQTYEVLLER